MIPHPYLDLKYPRLMEQAGNRLAFAPNLCGMGGYSAIDKFVTELALTTTLSGGWAHGLLPLVVDVASFVERDPDFVNDYGHYHIGKIAALMSDAIKAGDRKKIEAAIVALGGTIYDH
jgi:hypothetical protein